MGTPCRCAIKAWRITTGFLYPMSARCGSYACELPRQSSHIGHCANLQFCRPHWPELADPTTPSFAVSRMTAGKFSGADGFLPV